MLQCAGKHSSTIIYHSSDKSSDVCISDKLPRLHKSQLQTTKSTGYSALPSPSRLMRRTNTHRDSVTDGRRATQYLTGEGNKLWTFPENKFLVKILVLVQTETPPRQRLRYINRRFTYLLTYFRKSSTLVKWYNAIDIMMISFVYCASDKKA